MSKMNDNVRRVLSQPEGTVLAAHVRKVDPPQFVAETTDDLFDGKDWGGEQCDNCGCSSYTIKRNETLPPWHAHGWMVVCSGDPDMAEEYARDGADPEQVEAVRTGCGTQYLLHWEQEERVTF